MTWDIYRFWTPRPQSINNASGCQRLPQKLSDFFLPDNKILKKAFADDKLNFSAIVLFSF